MHYFAILFRVLVNGRISEIGTIGHTTKDSFCETLEVKDKIIAHYLQKRTGIKTVEVTILSATELTEVEYHNHSSTFISFS